MAETSTIEGTSSSSTINQSTPNKPLIREGCFASCIRCGNTGVKDTFYGRGKQYCSQNCVKGTTPTINNYQQTNNLIYQKQLNTASFKPQFNLPFNHLNQQQSHLASTSTTSNVQNNVQSNVQKLPIKLNHNLTTNQSSHQFANKPSLIIKEEPNLDNVNSNCSNSKDMKNKNNKTTGKSNHNNSIGHESNAKSKTNSFDWCTLLNKDSTFRAAPVSSFKHVPASNLWYNLISKNLKVEIRHKDALLTGDLQKTPNDIYWIATVIKVEGYYLLLRYEGYENDSSDDFWINIYNPIMHPVGWSALQKKHLIPPKSISDKQIDWKNYLIKNLIGAKTLPNDFFDQIKECLKSNLRIGMKLEVVDKARISSVRLATINKIIGCRLHVVYDGLEDKDNGFWCHQQSNLIHPIGWAQLVGHELRSTSEYAMSSLTKARTGNWDSQDASFDYFPHLKKQMESDKNANTNKGSNCRFVKGMKLEAIDPLNLSTICCATVTKVLRYNYIMVGIDGMMASDGSDWFCYHASSSNIFPVGTCNLKKLPLTPPRDYPKPFNWFTYLKENKAQAAPVSLFNNEQPVHGFKKGMYLEAVDLMEPRLICVAMVKEVVGRLLKIHFNGWDSSYDQWCDCESVELFPVGWCEIVGYPLEPPKEDTNPNDPSSTSLTTLNSFVFDNTIKKRGKQPYKGRSKKRKRNYLSISDKLNGSSAKDDEELILMNNNDQDNSTSLFNSIDDDCPMNETNKEDESMKISDDDDEKLTCNSTVTIKPSPLILNKRMNSSKQSELNLTEWSVQDVVKYFESNDLGSVYCNSFLEHNIDGKELLKLTRQEVFLLMQNKLGPSLKCYTLVEELKKSISSNN